MADYRLDQSLIRGMEKSLKYLLSYLTYRMHTAETAAELNAYSRLYEDVLKDPDQYKIAVLTDISAADLQAMLAKEGIHIKTEYDIEGMAGPARDDIVLFEAKDEAAILSIMDEYVRRHDAARDNLLYEEREFGFYNERKDEFIPYTDGYGNYIDRNGDFVKSDICPDSLAEEMENGLRSRRFQDGALWTMNPDGTLSDTFGDVYSRVTKDGMRYDPEIGKFTPTQEAAEFYAAHHERYSGEERVFTRTEYGNMRDTEGRIVEVRNDYGDVIHENGTVSFNSEYSGHEEERLQILIANGKDAGKTYALDKDGNFTDGRETVYNRDEHGGFVRNWEYIQSAPQRERVELAQDYRMSTSGFTSVNGEHTISLQNEYGDYFDKKGNLVLNPAFKGNEDARADLLFDQFADMKSGVLYQLTENGNFIVKGTERDYNGRYPEGAVIQNYRNGATIDENTGIRTVSDVYRQATLEGELQYVRVPGGYRSTDGHDFITSFNAYGDRYDPVTQEVVLNPKLTGHEEQRIAKVLRQEQDAHSDSTYILTDYGNLRDTKTGDVIHVCGPQGERYSEKDGSRITSFVFVRDTLFKTLGIREDEQDQEKEEQDEEMVRDGTNEEEEPVEEEEEKDEEEQDEELEEEEEETEYYDLDEEEEEEKKKRQQSEETQAEAEVPGEEGAASNGVEAQAEQSEETIAEAGGEGPVGGEGLGEELAGAAGIAGAAGAAGIAAETVTAEATMAAGAAEAGTAEAGSSHGESVIQDEKIEAFDPGKTEKAAAENGKETSFVSEGVGTEAEAPETVEGGNASGQGAKAAEVYGAHAAQSEPETVVSGAEQPGGEQVPVYTEKPIEGAGSSPVFDGTGNIPSNEVTKAEAEGAKAEAKAPETSVYGSRVTGNQPAGGEGFVFTGAQAEETAPSGSVEQPETFSNAGRQAETDFTAEKAEAAGPQGKPAGQDTGYQAHGSGEQENNAPSGFQGSGQQAQDSGVGFTDGMYEGYHPHEEKPEFTPDNGPKASASETQSFAGYRTEQTLGYGSTGGEESHRVGTMEANEEAMRAGQNVGTASVNRSSEGAQAGSGSTPGQSSTAEAPSHSAGYSHHAGSGPVPEVTPSHGSMGHGSILQDAAEIAGGAAITGAALGAGTTVGAAGATLAGAAGAVEATIGGATGAALAGAAGAAEAAVVGAADHSGTPKADFAGSPKATEHIVTPGAADLSGTPKAPDISGSPKAPDFHGSTGPLPTGTTTGPASHEPQSYTGYHTEQPSGLGRHGAEESHRVGTMAANEEAMRAGRNAGTGESLGAPSGGATSTPGAAGTPSPSMPYSSHAGHVGDTAKVETPAAHVGEKTPSGSSSPTGGAPSFHPGKAAEGSSFGNTPEAFSPKAKQDASANKPLGEDYLYNPPGTPGHGSASGKDSSSLASGPTQHQGHVSSGQVSGPSGMSAGPSDHGNVSQGTVHSTESINKDALGQTRSGRPGTSVPGMEAGPGAGKPSAGQTSSVQTHAGKSPAGQSPAGKAPANGPAASGPTGGVAATGGATGGTASVTHGPEAQPGAGQFGPGPGAGSSQHGSHSGASQPGSSAPTGNAGSAGIGRNTMDGYKTFGGGTADFGKKAEEANKPEPVSKKFMHDPDNMPKKTGESGSTSSGNSEAGKSGQHSGAPKNTQSGGADSIKNTTDANLSALGATGSKLNNTADKSGAGSGGARNRPGSTGTASAGTGSRPGQQSGRVQQATPVETGSRPTGPGTGAGYSHGGTAGTKAPAGAASPGVAKPGSTGAGHTGASTSHGGTASSTGTAGMTKVYGFDAAKVGTAFRANAAREGFGKPGAESGAASKDVMSDYKPKQNVGYDPKRSSAHFDEKGGVLAGRTYTRVRNTETDGTVKNSAGIVQNTAGAKLPGKGDSGSGSSGRGRKVKAGGVALSKLKSVGKAAGGAALTGAAAISMSGHAFAQAARNGADAFIKNNYTKPGTEMNPFEAPGWNTGRKSGAGSSASPFEVQRPGYGRDADSRGGAIRFRFGKKDGERGENGSRFGAKSGLGGAAVDPTKRPGFNSLEAPRMPGKPSTFGLQSASTELYSGLIYGAFSEPDPTLRAVRQARPALAGLKAISGITIARAANGQMLESMQRIVTSDAKFLDSLNSVLKAHGYDTFKAGSVFDGQALGKYQKALFQIAKDNKLIEMRGKNWVLKKEFQKGALGLQGLSSTNILNNNKFREHLSKTLIGINAKKAVTTNLTRVRSGVVSAFMRQANDETAEATQQGMRKARASIDTLKGIRNARNSYMLNRADKFKAVYDAGARQGGAVLRLRKFEEANLDPLKYKPGKNGKLKEVQKMWDLKKKDPRAVAQYKQLREQAKIEKNIMKHPNRYNALQKKASGVRNRSAFFEGLGEKFKEKTGINWVNTKVDNLKRGVKEATVGAVKRTRVYRVLSNSKAGKAVKTVTEVLTRSSRTVAVKLAEMSSVFLAAVMKFMLIYAIVVAVFCVLALLFGLPALGTMSAERSDGEFSVKTMLGNLVDDISGGGD